MRPIARRLNHSAAVELTVAEEQGQYKPLTMARVTHPDGDIELIGRWTFTPEERKRIANGEDIYVRFPGYTYPHAITLRPDWAGDPDGQ